MSDRILKDAPNDQEISVRLASVNDLIASEAKSH